MKVMKNILIIIGLMFVHLSMQAMLTKVKTNTFKRSWALPSFQQTRTGVTVTFTPIETGWKEYALPNKRFLSSLIPFTQAYYDYHKKKSDLWQFKNFLDGWEEIICKKYSSKQEKNEGLQRLLNGMRDFDLQSISSYPKDAFLYMAALLMRCFTWFEENRDVEGSEFMNALINYFSNMPKIINMRHINADEMQKEYPFLHALEIYMQRFGAEKMKKQQQQQTRTGQEQSQPSSTFQQGLQTKKILGLPENASDSQVRAVRNKFLLENHPDITKNLVKQSRMTQVEANRRNAKLIELNRAYAHEYEGHRE